MIRVSALYPNGPDTTFDFDYYGTTHRELVQRLWAPMGLLRLEMDRGLDGLDGGPGPYRTCGYLYFDSVDALHGALEAHGAEILGDIPNFTNVEPVLQISEMMDG